MKLFNDVDHYAVPNAKQLNLVHEIGDVEQYANSTFTLILCISVAAFLNTTKT